ncbi:DUF3667 domain-containing protein [Chitinophaga arvensicola]|uniref:DUF3667 domain-containing protein n=1 Tax=Chitinophaga arvensicola TaxID=29529 RepID=A0A1I0SB23_9BACT|nr:DUF3667 domain-containing protein [Chitinophaga arvensicola]SEW53717.1 Protein of unknown function [Chitinophaga arvensicola]
MKSQPLRKDKHCLNCGTEVPERYCTHCGQENTVPHETFSHLVKHFVADIFHYDSQFLTTLKYLLFRPGFLTREYMAGRRVRYVNPIKLYVFVSFVFFFGVFSLYHDEKPEQEKKEAALVATRNSKDSLSATDGPEAIRQAFKDDSSAVGENMNRLANDMDQVRTVAQFDSLQKALPDSEKLHGTARLAFRRLIGIKEKYGGDTKKAMIEMFTHNIPKMMFVLLPLFALFMKWIYDKKKWLYADHAIFAIHLHSFAFIVGLAGFLLDLIFHIDFFVSLAWWLFFGYLVLALYNNYKQSLWKSFLKSIFLFVAYFFAILLVFAGFVGLMFAIFL